MAYSYRTGCSYDNEWFSRVPFYWSSVAFWQKVMSYGEGAPWYLITPLFHLAIITTFACLIQYSLVWIIPTVVAALAMIAQAVITVIIATSLPVDYERDNDLNLDNYYKLPKKVRKQLRPAAKYVNKLKGDYYSGSDKELKKWSRLVDGHLKLNPYEPPVKKTSLVLEQESTKLKTLLEVDEAERAKIEYQRKITAEIDAEVKERIKAQLKLEGKEYIELNV